MKALKILKEDRDYRLSINNDKSIIEKYDEAISEIYSLLVYKYLADTYLKIEKCKCGMIKVQGYLCPNRNCEEEYL